MTYGQILGIIKQKIFLKTITKKCSLSFSYKVDIIK